MKELSLSVDEAVKYLKENVKIHDNLEISYNRILLKMKFLIWISQNILKNLVLRF